MARAEDVQGPAEHVAQAATSGRHVRIHTSDGEVVVARILFYDEDEVIYAPITSSRPERYAVCDATGFGIPFSAIIKTQLLGPYPAGPDLAS